MHDGGGDEPGEGGGVAGCEEGPAPGGGLVLDGYDGGQTGEVEEDEEEVGVGREGREAVGGHLLVETCVFGGVFGEAVIVAEAVIAGVEDAHGGGYDLLGADACDEADVELPVEALRREEGFDGLAGAAEVGGFHGSPSPRSPRGGEGLLSPWEGGRHFLRGQGFLPPTGGVREGPVAKCPDDDGGDEDDAAHLLEVLLAFLPGVAPDGFGGGPAVGRQLHDEGGVLALDDEAREEAGDEDGHEDADGVERDHHPGAPLGREEGAHDHYIYR